MSVILVFGAEVMAFAVMIETFPGIAAISLWSAVPVVTTLSSSFVSKGFCCVVGVFVVGVVIVFCVVVLGAFGGVDSCTLASCGLCSCVLDSCVCGSCTLASC